MGLLALCWPQRKTLPKNARWPRENSWEHSCVHIRSRIHVLHSTKPIVCSTILLYCGEPLLNSSLLCLVAQWWAPNCLFRPFFSVIAIPHELTVPRLSSRELIANLTDGAGVRSRVRVRVRPSYALGTASTDDVSQALVIDICPFF